MRNAYKISLLRINNIEQILKQKYDINELKNKYNSSSYVNLKYINNSYEVVSNEDYLYYCALQKNQYCNARLETDQREEVENTLINEIKNVKLNPMLMSIYINELIDVCSLKQKDIAQRSNVTSGTISNKRRLSGLPIKVQSLLLKEKLKERHARAILKLRNNDDYTNVAEFVANKIVEDNLKVDEAEDLINNLLGNPITKRESLYIKNYSSEKLVNPTTQIVINHVDNELKKSFEQISKYFPNLDIELEKGVDKEDFIFLIKLKGINKNG